jgi:TrmH family RNA methyltransferase
MTVIRSRENARVKAWRRMADDPRERRRLGLALIEGVHLVEAYLSAGLAPASVIAAESALRHPEVARLLAQAGGVQFVLIDALFKSISDAETPAGIAAEIAVPALEIDPAASAGCVFLEGIQDAGNVGAILRSAAAFGIPDAVCGPGCADPWSPKALRAGMGAHFHLRIASSADLASSVRRFGLDSICTDVHGGSPVDATDLKGRIGWVFGSEGSGVSPAVAAAATRRVTVSMPGSAESLNVAACAAICFYERQRQLSKRAAPA